ncbi:hypothetical protein RO1_32920 [Roseburia intestinalis XB6B4]|uniref:Uncharacterized protein n=1 Tax=Roseburia intestinalis XB6B4 TaxID=718255 RepID=D4L1W6_9FIRM|nr:hypothetical protein RO1_32920 [Roseburia intestinalis XB6B4]
MSKEQCTGYGYFGGNR